MPFVPQGMKRVFLAFPLDVPTKQKIAALIKQLQPHFDSARWVHWENFHITLHFIGEVQIDSIGEIKDSIEPVVRRYHKQNIMINKLDYFGSSRKPRVLMLTASPKSALPLELSSLAYDLHKIFEKQVEISTFIVHITLARYRMLHFSAPYSKLNEESLEAIKGRELTWGGQSKSDSQSHSTAIKKHATFYDFEPLNVSIDRVVLYESVSTPQGVKYEELANISLSET
jgi:RNA 2',3'-cyclic 3'-phosphodiesterase